VRLPPCARPNGAACRPRRCCQATSNINIDHRGWLSKQFCYQDLGPVSKLQHRRVFQSSCATIKALWLTQCDQVIDPAWHRRPLLFRPPHSSLPSATFLQRRSSTCCSARQHLNQSCKQKRAWMLWVYTLEIGRTMLESEVFVRSRTHSTGESLTLSYL
jgi:hypothetical protein